MKNCRGARTVGIMVSNGEKIIIYNEVFLAYILLTHQQIQFY